MEKIVVKCNILNVQKYVSDDNKVVKYYIDCFETYKDKKTNVLKASRLRINQKYQPSIYETEVNKYSWLIDLPTFSPVNLVLEFDFRSNKTRVIDIYECTVDTDSLVPITILV